MKPNIKSSIRSCQIWVLRPKEQTWSSIGAYLLTCHSPEFLIINLNTENLLAYREFKIKRIPKPQTAIRVPPKMKYYEVEITGSKYHKVKYFGISEINFKKDSTKSFTKYQY